MSGFESFQQREPITVRIKGILTEYPDGSQILREILQNSDDAGSTEQVFLLDHHTYPTDTLVDPDLARCQGPSLLAKNDTPFRKQDFESLSQLGNSIKQEEVNKTGRYGIGFNAVYHLTDMPMVLSGDQLVIIDPHERIKAADKAGGVRCNFAKNSFREKYAAQLEPFKELVKDFQSPFKGTVFRYPLRTKNDAEQSKISQKVYTPKGVLDMFKMFQAEAVECLLFLKYIETVSFYEWGVDDTEPRLLYQVELMNGDNVRKQRRLLAEKVNDIIDDIGSKPESLSSGYIAEFRRFSHEYSNDDKSLWAIQNHLGNVWSADEYFFKTHGVHIKPMKLIPWVGVAARVSDTERHDGRLFCFLPLPISTPFNVHIHGFFAMSSSRREIPVPSEDDVTGLVAIKGDWNRYLFQHCVPQAWADLLEAVAKCASPNTESKFVALVQSRAQLKIESASIAEYRLWPLGGNRKEGNRQSRNVEVLWKNLLEAVVRVVGERMSVFPGLSSDVEIATPDRVEEKWMSLEEGTIEKTYHRKALTTVLARTGLPMILNLPSEIRQAIQTTSVPHRRASEIIVRQHLKKLPQHWITVLDAEDKNLLLEYVISDKEYKQLRGLPLVPLCDGSYTSLDLPKAASIYTATPEEHYLFRKWANRLVSPKIPDSVRLLIDADAALLSTSTNLRRWSFETCVDYLTQLFSSIPSGSQDTIPWASLNDLDIDLKWLERLWKWIDIQPASNLSLLNKLWLIPTSQDTLRKFHCTKPILWRDPTGSTSPKKDVISLLEKVGNTFILDGFLSDKGSQSALRNVVVDCSDVDAVLRGVNPHFNVALTENEVKMLRQYFAKYIRLLSNELSKSALSSLKKLPIFPNRSLRELSNTSISSSDTFYAINCSSIGEVVPRVSGVNIIDVSNPDIMYLAVEVVHLKQLDTTEYLRRLVVPNLKSQEPDIIGALIDRVLEHLPRLVNNANVVRQLGHVPFVTVGPPDGRKKSKVKDRFVAPVDVVDRDSELKKLYLSDEEVFPTRKYAQRYAVGQLRDLGMNTKLNVKIVIDRVSHYIKSWTDSTTATEKKEIHKTALNFLRLLDKGYQKFVEEGAGDVRNMERLLSKQQWIPAVSERGTEILSEANKIRDNDQEYLTSRVMPTVNHCVKCDKLRRLLGWDVEPDIEIVGRQLLKLLEEYASATKNSAKLIEEDLERMFNHLNKVAKNDLNMDVDHLRTVLENKAWIPIEGMLYMPSQVALSTPSEIDLKPFIMTIPTHMEKFKTLFEALDVPRALDAAKLVGILQKIKAEVSDKALKPKELKLVMSLLSEITNESVADAIISKLRDDLLAPAANDTLVEISKLTFNDVSRKPATSETYLWCHKKVSSHMAEMLGIPLLTQKLMFELGDEAQIFDDELFEPGEPFTTRIKNLLAEYPDDALFREFLQNADDAEATEFRIIYDPKEYDSQTVISKGMAEWQGPALFIYNNKVFSDQDFRGLTQVGVGGKRNDNSVKIGRFGLGFLDCYHFTDVPSIVSGSHVVFLDPHKTYLPRRLNGKPNAGFRKNFVQDNLASQFEDQFEPYKQHFGCDMSKPIDGTIFRLPLRTVDIAKKSDISDKTYTSTIIGKLLENFRNQAFRGALLFLKHIEKIEVYKAGDDGQLERLWAVTVDELSEEARRKRRMVEKNQVYSTSFLLNVRMSDSRGQAMQKWLVTTALSELPPNLKQFAKRNRLVAHTGVAGLLEPFRDAYPSSTGTLFSFLPLPICTELPVHLQGCFALSSDRRSIILPDTTASQEERQGESWNEFLLGTLLPQRHLEFLQNLAMHKERSLVELARENKNLMTEEYMAKFIDKYYMYWPSQCNSMLKTYCSRFWDFPPGNHMKIFYTLNGGGKWTSYSHAVFEDIELSKNPTRRRVIRDLLIKRDYEIVQIPKRFIEQELVPKKSQHITRDLVRKGIQNTTVVDGMPKDDLAVLLEYILEVGKFADLRGCTLLPLMNGTLGILTEGCQYFVAELAEIDLFSHLSARFVDCSDLPESIIHNLCTPEAAQELGIKRFDEETLVQFLSEVLPSGTQLEYDHDGTTIPNDKWLLKLWKYLDAKDTVEVKSIAKFPLLPTVKDGSKPMEELVSLDPQLPRIIHSSIYPEINAILRKTGTFLIDKMYTKRLSNYVLEFTPTNVLKCIHLAGKTKGISVEELMSTFKLTSSECEALRNFVQKNEFSLLDSGAKGFSSETSSVLEQLPIWPVHSSTGKTRFKAAKDCYLLPPGLSAFSVPSGSRVAIVSMEPKIDRNFVSKIGTRNLSTEEHFERNVLPSLQSPLPADKIPAYVEFLNQILRQSESRLHTHLCRLLSQHKILLSDGPTSDLYRPDQLYDHATTLFGTVFEGAGKFVAPKLRGNLAAIRGVGLKSNVDGATFLECAAEIHRLSNLVQPPLGDNILNRAKSVISHLNSNLGIALHLQSNQLDQLVQLPIVPVENTATRLPKFAQLFAHARSTLGLYPFSAVCAPEHRDIVWTQRPIYDANLFIPSPHVLNNVTTLRKPSVETVLDHLETLALKVSKCCPDEQNEFNRMLEKTYIFLEECLEKKHAVELIGKRVSRPESLFLNGDDPTDPQSWKPAQCLVHGAANDAIQPPWFKIHKNLEPFHHLLKLGGAISVEKVDTKIVIQNDTQNEVILRNLTDFYNCTNDPAIEGYKDVIFVVKGKKFPAFRLVLAAASEYFRNMFFGQTRESLHAQLPIEVTVDDITPTSFRIVLDYLHTGRIKVGPGDVADDCGWSGDHPYRYLQVYLDLLQSADKLLLDNMKQMIEKDIVIGDMIGIETVLQVEEYTKKFHAEQLEDHCRRFRLANESLIVPLDPDDE